MEVEIDPNHLSLIPTEQDFLGKEPEPVNPLLVNKVHELQVLEEDTPNDLGVQIIDNMMPADAFEQMHSMITDKAFPWGMQNKVSYDILKKQDEEAGGDGSIDYGRWENDKEFVDFNNLQFRHIFYFDHVNQSEYTQYLWPLLSGIRTPSWMRIRATLNQYTSKHIMLGGYHSDIPPAWHNLPITTGLFYFNTNNGYTEFKDGYRVNNVANRLLLFPCPLKHSAVSCTDKQYRLQLNLNLVTPVDPVERIVDVEDADELEERLERVEEEEQTI